MICAFIGDYEQSLENMLAVSFMLFHKYRKTILLPECHFMGTDLECAFHQAQNSYIKEDSFLGVKEGMDYLLYRNKQEILNDSIIKEGITYLTDGFGYVKSAIQGDYQNFCKLFVTACENLGEMFRNHFDIVLYQCGMGEREEERKLMQACDMIVYNGTMEELPHLQRKFQWDKMDKPFFFLLKSAFEDFRSELQYLTNFWRLDFGQIGVVPYNAELQRCMSGGQAWDYYRRKIENPQLNTFRQQEYYNQLQTVSKQILKWMEKYEDRYANEDNEPVDDNSLESGRRYICIRRIEEMDSQAKFIEMIEDVVALAKMNNRETTTEFLEEYFKEMELNEAQMKLVYDYLSSHHIQVKGYEKEGAQVSAEAHNQEAHSSVTGEQADSAADTVTGEQMADSVLAAESNCLDIYLKELAETVCSSELDMKLVQSMLSGDEAARNKVVEHFLPLVVEEAKLLDGQGLSQADLIQEGNIGLLMGLADVASDDSYEVMKETVLKSVKEAMYIALDEVTDQKKTSMKIIKKADHVKEKAEEMEEIMKDKFSIEDMAEYMEMDVEEIQDILRMTGEEL